MSEWNGCPYFRPEKSDPGSVYCECVGGSPELGFYRAYCQSKDPEVQQICPYLGGDNHLVNEDCLTEKECQYIYNGVWTNLELSGKYISEFAVELYESVGQTGYVYLAEEIENAAYQRVATPQATGLFKTRVETEPERQRAEQLENNLDNLFRSYQPDAFFGGDSNMSGSVVLSSDAFDASCNICDNYAFKICRYLLYPIPSTTSHGYTAQSLLEQQEYYVRQWLDNIRGSIEEAQAYCERSINRVKGQIGGLSRGGPGYTPKWNT